MSTSPFASSVAVWWCRAPAIEVAGSNEPPAPSPLQISAVASTVLQLASAHPPATRTLPSRKSVALCPARGEDIEPASDHVSATGS